MLLRVEVGVVEVKMVMVNIEVVCSKRERQIERRGERGYIRMTETRYILMQWRTWRLAQEPR